jgi:hypothetical protein
VFSRCQKDNVSTELLPSNDCCTVGCSHSCYLIMRLHEGQHCRISMTSLLGSTGRVTRSDMSHHWPSTCERPGCQQLCSRGRRWTAKYSPDVWHSSIINHPASSLTDLLLLSVRRMSPNWDPYQQKTDVWRERMRNGEAVEAHRAVRRRGSHIF